MVRIQAKEKLKALRVRDQVLAHLHLGTVCAIVEESSFRFYYSFFIVLELAKRYMFSIPWLINLLHSLSSAACFVIYIDK